MMPSQNHSTDTGFQMARLASYSRCYLKCSLLALLAVVLLVWNIRGENHGRPRVSFSYACWEWGWPMTWLRHDWMLISSTADADIPVRYLWLWQAFPEHEYDFSPLALVVDIGVAISLLVGIPLASRRWIRTKPGNVIQVNDSSQNNDNPQSQH